MNSADDRSSEDDGGFTRRRVLRSLAAGTLTALAANASAMPRARRLQAIAFDAFPIFDNRSVAGATRNLFPEKGEALASAWTAKLFSYSWLVSSGEKYIDFRSLAIASLKFSADSMGITIEPPLTAELVDSYGQLGLWPDVMPALERLRSQNIRIAFLSNMGESMLRTNMRRAGIEKYFEHTLSTDRVRHYKPAPLAYQMAVDAFGLRRSQIGFAASASWDAIGATWFGYPTVWVNRAGAPAEALEIEPRLTSANLAGVLALAQVG